MLVLWPHCLSLWKSQSYLQNECELFIQGSNPQIYCHLICGYGTALMALMPSNRCPYSATQVRLHLVTPLSPGTWWPTAHFIFSSGGPLNENMYQSHGASKRKSCQMLTSNICDPKIFEHGVNMNIMCLSGWLLCVFVLFLAVYPCLAVLLNSAEIAWIEILGVYSLHTWCCFHIQKGTDHFTSKCRLTSGGVLHQKHRMNNNKQHQFAHLLNMLPCMVRQ